MTARMLTAHGRRSTILLACSIPLLAGCQGLFGSHAEKRIPQYGVVDPNLTRELKMVSLPPYVVEPPDELEITVRPATVELATTTLPVQPDGNVDLGFNGDVYVAGLTLEQVEQKIAQHLTARSGPRPPRQPYEVSVRLVNGSQSKFYYVLGTVTTQGRFPITGNETVLDAILAAGLRSNSLPEKSYLVR